MKRLVWIAVTCLAAVPACGGDDDDDGAIDAAPTPDGAPVADAAPEADAGPTAEQRGQYLVEVVGACTDCHTPRNEDGSLDTTRFLGGNPSFVDIDPKNDEAGNLPTPNLTPDATGLADWTDEEIQDAFLNGNGRDGDVLFPVMPYYVFHNMTADDADAIVAFLRTIPAVDQEIPDEQPPFSLLPAPADPFPVDAIPDHSLKAGDPDFEAAERGRYLAGFIGVCMECHTERTDPNDPSSLDQKLLFAGGEAFDIGGPFGVVLSANITPDDDTGIGGYSVGQVRAVLKEGTDIEGDPLCPPMPVGPLGAFGGFTDADADAIGTFLLNMAPISNEIAPECTPPGIR